ncbi:hypothetical protein DBR42_02305 [Pelomonas sp. HMWF004]|nr:hypothetical protein DBR42_02305 [Pelomonas sp. HMWF004]
MAGSIIVAKNGLLHLNTLAFDYVVERIRPYFQVINEEAMRLVYEPLDQGGMTFIALDEIPECHFRDFCRAFAEARLVANASAPTEYDVWWERLLEILKKDPRFDA